MEADIYFYSFDMSPADTHKEGENLLDHTGGSGAETQEWWPCGHLSGGLLWRVHIYVYENKVTIQNVFLFWVGMKSEVKEYMTEKNPNPLPEMTNVCLEYFPVEFPQEWILFCDIFQLG